MRTLTTMDDPLTTLTIRGHFDAAHRMVPADSPEYERWHGHTYHVELTACLRRPTWQVAPLDVMRRIWSEVHGELDHRTLACRADVEGAQIDGALVFDDPVTMEMLAWFILDRLKEELLKEHKEAKALRVRVSSQPDAYAEASL